MVGDGGGTLPVNGRFDVTDAGGDIASVSFLVYDNNGNLADNLYVPYTGPPFTAGTLSGQLIVTTSAAGTFTFRIQVADAAGGLSNTLSGTFAVVPDPWKARSAPLPAGTGINCVAFGGGTFVAGTDGQTILRSIDGTNWSAATEARLQAIAYGSGTFVAAGDCTVAGTLERLWLTSTDNGATWATAAGAPEIHGITFGNGTFVAVGFGGDVWTSTDNGAGWVNRSPGASFDLNAVAFGSGTFVAVGAGGTIVSSTDNGASWTPRTSGTGSAILSVTYGNGTFVALTYSGFILTSSDGGANWTATPWPFGSEFVSKWLQDITYGTGGFVGVGVDDGLSERGILISSPDGVAWSARSLGTGWLHAVAFGNGTFVAVGDNAAIFQSDPGWSP